jgi:uncharacterized protein
MTLPAYFNPIQLAQEKAYFDDYVTLSVSERLEDLLQQSSLQLHLQLQFLTDDYARVILQGRLQGKLPLQCQRCVGKLAWPMDETFSLVPVRTVHEAKQLEEPLEPWFLQDQEITLQTLLEEQILLVLPYVPKHENLSCNEALQQKQAQQGFKEDHPFSKLAVLKKRQ